MWYDPKLDKDLIESSFAKQYGIRLSIEDISYPEYRRLFNGLMGDTPLGRIISIRSESNRDTIKKFSSEEKKVWKEWNDRRIKQKLDSMSIEEKKKQVEAFQKAMKEAFYKGGDRKGK